MKTNETIAQQTANATGITEQQAFDEIKNYVYLEISAASKIETKEYANILIPNDDIIIPDFHAFERIVVELESDGFKVESNWYGTNQQEQIEVYGMSTNEWIGRIRVDWSDVDETI